MLFADHVRRLASLCFYWLRQLRSIRWTLTTETTTILLYDLVISRIDCCNRVLAGAYDVHLRQLQAVLNAAARLIVRKRKYDSISSPALATNSSTGRVQDVCSRVQLPAQSPSYLSSMCQPVSVNPSRRCLRSAARGDLVVTATRTVCYGPRSFAVAGPATWNSLPASFRDDQLSVACISPSIQD